MENVVKSATRSDGKMAGVFEFDEDTSYFYLGQILEPGHPQILASIHIESGEPTFSEPDVHIKWNSEQDMVALHIGDQLCAVFDCTTNISYGGNYEKGYPLVLTPELMKRLNPA